MSEGRLEPGSWQQILYADLDGRHPKRIPIKLMGNSSRRLKLIPALRVVG